MCTVYCLYISQRQRVQFEHLTFSKAVQWECLGTLINIKKKDSSKPCLQSLKALLSERLNCLAVTTNLLHIETLIVLCCNVSFFNYGNIKIPENYI